MPEHTKSAETHRLTIDERADAIVEQLNAWGHDVGRLSREFIRLHMEILCRDQRHLCADAVTNADYNARPTAPVDTAYTAVLNAPEPGRENQ